MTIKLNDTQLVLLSAASQREDHCLAPPEGSRRAQAQRAVGKLLEAGLLKEIRVKAGAPIWRRNDETGQTYALKLTTAGVKAIAVGETMPSEGEAELRPDHPTIAVDPKPEPDSDPAPAIDKPNDGVASTPTSPRGGTKVARVIELLQRRDGATLDELVVAMGWLPHTTRAALTGLRKRGYVVMLDRSDQRRDSVYRLAFDANDAEGSRRVHGTTDGASDGAAPSAPSDPSASLMPSARSVSPSAPRRTRSAGTSRAA